MLILRSIFGHDSSITLLKNEQNSFALKEPHTKNQARYRNKFKDIDGALKNFNYKIDQIDYCSVTSNTKCGIYIF